MDKNKKESLRLTDDDIEQICIPLHRVKCKNLKQLFKALKKYNSTIFDVNNGNWTGAVAYYYGDKANLLVFKDTYCTEFMYNLSVEINDTRDYYLDAIIKEGQIYDFTKAKVNKLNQNEIDYKALDIFKENLEIYENKDGYFLTYKDPAIPVNCCKSLTKEQYEILKRIGM